MRSACHVTFPVPQSLIRMTSSVSGSLSRRIRPLLMVGIPALMAILGFAATAAAHDFWIIPDFFVADGEAVVHVKGMSGTRFPAGSAVQPARIAEARLIGAAGETKITEMAVEGTALRLHQKPAAAGQYVVAVAMASRTTRSTPAGLLRFLRLEGGAGEAAHIERDSSFSRPDSVTYASTSYAATAVQVGRGGPRAFSRSTGFPLEFVPVSDPAHLHVGDTLHVRMIGGGQPVAGIAIDATGAIDSTGRLGSSPVSLLADANGIAHVPLTKEGPWMLRSAFVIRHAGGAANEWDVARTTYVFNVGAHH